jgi:hypothetical protein
MPLEAPTGQDFSVWCAVDSSVRGRKVILFYRPRGASNFEKVEMDRKQGWFVATIPGSAMDETVQHYVESQSANDNVLAATGGFANPNLLIVSETAEPVDPVMTESRLAGPKRKRVEVSDLLSEDDSDDPLGAQNEDDADARPALVGSAWAVRLAVGTGFGFHPDAQLEYRLDQEKAGGFAPMSLLHILPEVTYRWNADWTFGIQTRHQIILHEGETGRPNGRPANGANIILLRALYTLWAKQSLSVFASGHVGGGEGFRLVISPDETAARPGTDTIRGGPVVFGAGVGADYVLSGPWALTGETRFHVGAPDFAVGFELNVGAQYRLP